MTVRLHRDVSLVGTDDGGVLLDQRSGEYWQLNRTAATTVRMLLDGACEQDVATALVAECPPGEVDPAQVLADVHELAEQLTAAKLAVRS
ncbi:hypothetical protein GCM10027271_40740 [Saccharopolyspora gloriosae]|uniref:Lasso peptide biosynthesis PqqD family chaperone n=1 Tax=Saccharopolyspora gloriosae TaxID=455344 RepID=A0A840NFK7_9PSEU|nr:lasso peptide biosynthesis PqqD family chaperone [Saccharopolyspora gloriosae]MBB5069043.1 hypothetical protein [Saccharopolyspora gloriosae]